MEIKFLAWSADEVINAYLAFVIKKHAKEVYVKYIGKKDGFKETMEGRIEPTNLKLKELAKKIQFTGSYHHLELSQKSWKIQLRLSLVWAPDRELAEHVVLSFDDSLQKEVLSHFRRLEPKILA